MMRAVRFASHFQFCLDPHTQQAITVHAHTVTAVSAERIAEEVRRMFVDPHCAAAACLLAETGLLGAILPEARWLPSSTAGQEAWAETLQVLVALRDPRFPAALAALLRTIFEPGQDLDAGIRQIGRRWRLASAEIDQTAWLAAHEQTIRRATRVPWPALQRVLIDERMDELLKLADAVGTRQLPAGNRSSTAAKSCDCLPTSSIHRRSCRATI